MRVVRRLSWSPLRRSTASSSSALIGHSELHRRHHHTICTESPCTKVSGITVPADPQNLHRESETDVVWSHHMTLLHLKITTNHAELSQL